jgi:hypothetical protein
METKNALADTFPKWESSEVPAATRKQPVDLVKPTKGQQSSHFCREKAFTGGEKLPSTPGIPLHATDISGDSHTFLTGVELESKANVCSALPPAASVESGLIPTSRNEKLSGKPKFNQLELSRDTNLLTPSSKKKKRANIFLTPERRRAIAGKPADLNLSLAQTCATPGMSSWRTATADSPLSVLSSRTAEKLFPENFVGLLAPVPPPTELAAPPSQAPSASPDAAQSSLPNRPLSLVPDPSLIHEEASPVPVAPLPGHDFEDLTTSVQEPTRPAPPLEMDATSAESTAAQNLSPLSAAFGRSPRRTFSTMPSEVSPPDTRHLLSAASDIESSLGSTLVSRAKCLCLSPPQCTLLWSWSVVTSDRVITGEYVKYFSLFYFFGAFLFFLKKDSQQLDYIPNSLVR